MDNNELYHHGVIGMKWGVRRYQKKDGSLTSAGKRRKRKTESEDYKVKSDRKKAFKNRRTLSDADLKKRIDRLKMEKEFKSLTQEDISPGKKFASEVISSAGKKTLTVAAAGAMAYGVKVAMTKKFDVKEAAAFIAANPNKKK